MRHGASGPAWKEEISETLSRKLAPVPEIKGLSSPYDGSRSRDDGPSQVAAARRTATTSRRRLRQAVAGCGLPGMIRPMRRPAGKESDLTDPIGFEEVFAALPLLHLTPRSWAELAAARLPEFLADHAVCEQQVAMYALSLAGYYPDDAELVERGAALAAEEVQHFRRVVAI